MRRTVQSIKYPQYYIIDSTIGGILSINHYSIYAFFLFFSLFFKAFTERPIRLRFTSTEIISASMISPTASTSDGC